jgi:hypothetical protein
MNGGLVTVAHRSGELRQTGYCDELKRSISFGTSSYLEQMYYLAKDEYERLQPK